MKYDRACAGVAAGTTKSLQGESDATLYLLFLPNCHPQILQVRLFSNNLSSRRCLVHVFRIMFVLIGAEIR